MGKRDGQTFPEMCPHCNSEIPNHTKKCLKKKKAFEARLARCEICKKAFLKPFLSAHMQRDHPTIPANLSIRFVLPEPPVSRRSKSQGRGNTPCKKCGVRVFDWAVERHLANFHSANSELEAFLRGAVKFPFVLLPPGKGRLRGSIEKYIRLTSARPYSLTNDSYDYERLSRIEALGEAACYVGVKLWKGYVAFDFPTTDKVVLECPPNGQRHFCAHKRLAQDDFAHEGRTTHRVWPSNNPDYSHFELGSSHPPRCLRLRCSAATSSLRAPTHPLKQIKESTTYILRITSSQNRDTANTASRVASTGRGVKGLYVLERAAAHLREHTRG